MKIAIPVWQDRISPVFDSSRRLLVVDVADRKAAARKEVELSDESRDRVRRLSDLSVDILICGAISEPLAEQVLAAGIRLIPFIAGEVDEIIRAYIEVRLPSPEFLMPGCCAQNESDRIFYETSPDDHEHSRPRAGGQIPRPRRMHATDRSG